MVPESEVNDFFAEINAIVAKFPEKNSCIITAEINKETSELEKIKSPKETVSLKRTYASALEADTLCAEKVQILSTEISDDSSISTENCSQPGKIEYLTEYCATDDSSADEDDKIPPSPHHNDAELAHENSPPTHPDNPIIIGPLLPPNYKEENHDSSLTERFIGPVLPSNLEDVYTPIVEVANPEDIKNRSKVIHDAFHTIAAKVSVLGESQPSFLQILLIQLMTRIADWECGALSLNYIEECLLNTESQMKEYEKLLLPTGWLSHWSSEKGNYFYENCSNGCRQWDFPSEDIQVNDESKSTDAQQEDKPRVNDETFVSFEDGEILESEEEKTAYTTINAEELLEEMFDQSRASNAMKQPTVECEGVSPAVSLVHSVDPSTVIPLLMAQTELVLANAAKTSQHNQEENANLLVGYSSSEGDEEDVQGTSESECSEDESLPEEEEILNHHPDKVMSQDMEIGNSDEENSIVMKSQNENVPNMDDALKEWEKMKMTLL